MGLNVAIAGPLLIRTDPVQQGLLGSEAASPWNSSRPVALAWDLPRALPQYVGQFPLASPLCARLCCSRYRRPGWISPPPPRVSAGRDDNAALRRPRPLHFSPRLPPLDGGRVHSGPLPDNPGPVRSGVSHGPRAGEGRVRAA